MQLMKILDTLIERINVSDGLRDTLKIELFRDIVSIKDY